MTKIINNIRIPVQCECGFEFQENYGWIKSEPELVCPACRGMFTIGKESLRSIIGAVEESLYRLNVIEISGQYFSTNRPYPKSRQAHAH